MSAKLTFHRSAQQTGLVRASSVLKLTHHDLVISKQKLNQAKGISLVKLSIASKSSRISVSRRAHLFCADCQFGHFRRAICFMNVGTGTSFCRSQDITISASRTAKIESCRFSWPRLRFDSRVLSCDFEVQRTCWKRSVCTKGGKQYRRLVAAFERIFGATIVFGTDEDRSKSRLVRMARFNFFLSVRSRPCCK